jgi:hypothetical protein
MRAGGPRSGTPRPRHRTSKDTHAQDACSQGSRLSPWESSSAHARKSVWAQGAWFLDRDRRAKSLYEATGPIHTRRCAEAQSPRPSGVRVDRHRPRGRTRRRVSGSVWTIRRVCRPGRVCPPRRRCLPVCGPWNPRRWAGDRAEHRLLTERWLRRAASAPDREQVAGGERAPEGAPACHPEGVPGMPWSPRPWSPGRSGPAGPPEARGPEGSARPAAGWKRDPRGASRTCHVHHPCKSPQAQAGATPSRAAPSDSAPAAHP